MCIIRVYMYVCIKSYSYICIKHSMTDTYLRVVLGPGRDRGHRGTRGDPGAPRQRDGRGAYACAYVCVYVYAMMMIIMV